MIGTDKQIEWAETIKGKTLEALASIASAPEFAEIEKVNNATWWIDRRNYPITADSLPDLIGCAWIENTGVGCLETAGESKVSSALRNGGNLAPLRYGFGTMCATYSHILTLRNGSQYVVSEPIAKMFLATKN